MMLAVSFDSLHQVLRTLYDDMMPLCGSMAGVAKGIAGLGALFYVASRVWKSLSQAEPIDVYPLLRPFVIGFCIMFFPTFVLGTLNTVLSPVVKGANNLMTTQTMDMNALREQRDRLENEAMRRNPETAYLVDNAAFDQKLSEMGVMDAPQIAGMYIEKGFYSFKQTINRWFMNLLELIFDAASLVIDTLRTFFLIVLAILGPIAFAISCWDGFQATLTQWIMRYVSVYMWLPVSDLFSSILARIQILMVSRDIDHLADPNFIPDGTNSVYIIFMLIGIIGYFTVPSVAGWVIQAGGLGNFGKNVNSTASGGGKAASAVGGAIAGNITGRLFGGNEGNGGGSGGSTNDGGGYGSGSSGSGGSGGA